MDRWKIAFEPGEIQKRLPRAKNWTVAAISCIGLLAYFSGVKRKDVPGIMVRDVLEDDGESIVEAMQCGCRTIYLNVNARAAITGYLKYVTENYQSIINSSGRLFPSYLNEKKLERDLEKIFGGKAFTFLRREGIKAFYKNYCDKWAHRFRGYSDRKLLKTEVYKKVAENYSLSEREVFGIITDSIPRPGETAADKARKFWLEAASYAD